MNKLTSAVGALALSTSLAQAEIPEHNDCKPLRDVVEGFSERYEQGILSMDISPQIERFYTLSQEEADGFKPNAEEAYRTGQELGMKMRLMGLQPFQMQYVLSVIAGAVEQCVSRSENAI